MKPSEYINKQGEKAELEVHRKNLNENHYPKPSFIFRLEAEINAIKYILDNFKPEIEITDPKQNL